MEKRADGYFFNNHEVNRAKRILTYIGLSTLGWKMLGFIISCPQRRRT